jgi:hypothetical protein
MFSSTFRCGIRLKETRLVLPKLINSDQYEVGLPFGTPGAGQYIPATLVQSGRVERIGKGILEDGRTVIQDVADSGLNVMHGTLSRREIKRETYILDPDTPLSAEMRC